MSLFCSHCGISAPNDGQCGPVEGTRHAFIMPDDEETRKLALKLKIEETKLARAHVETLYRKRTRLVYSEHYSLSETYSTNTDAVWFNKNILPKLIPLVEYKGNDLMAPGIVINTPETYYEQDLVAEIYPILVEMFGEKCSVLNSEVYQWLPQDTTNDSKSTYYKPDIHLSVGAFYYNQLPKLRTEGVKYGIPPIQLLSHVLGILEAKVHPLAASHKGVLFKYLLSLLAYQECAKGLVFNKTEAIYAEVKRSGEDSFEVVVYEHMQFSEQGSKERIVELFDIHNPVLFDVIARASTVLGILIGSVLQFTEGNSFLGRGAYGHVFKLKDAAKNKYALKIVCTDDVVRESKSVVAQYVQAEYERVLWFNNHESLKDVFCRAVPASLETDTVHNSFMYYLMSDVGVEFEASNKSSRRQAWDLLQKLHQAGQVHGDARSQNIVVLPIGRMRFVDPRNHSPTMQTYFHDLRSLIISMYILSDEVFEMTEAVLQVCQQQSALEPANKSYKALFQLCESTWV